MREDGDDLFRYARMDSRVCRALEQATRSVSAAMDDAVLCGAGGQGLVFKVNSREFPFPVMIKIPFYTRYASAPLAEHAILKEGLVLQTAWQFGFQHFLPRFVSVDGNGEYLIREYIEGVSLSDRLGSMSFAQRSQLLAREYEMTNELFCVFHNNPTGCVVIRDFKANNIIYDSCGNMKLIDYGSVRRENELDYHKRALPGKELGSGKYLFRPIEQMAEIKGLLSRKMDYFAYGVLMFYTLFLQYPFSNTEPCLEDARRRYNEEYEIVKSKLATMVDMYPHMERWRVSILDALRIDPRRRSMH